jgi:hypothetical protein
MQCSGKKTEGAGQVSACPKTRRNRFRTWMFPLIGIASFLWFLIRVLPKPSRAAYPCQRVAAPLAASFVVWITGLACTAFAYRKWRTAILGRRRLATVVCAVAALAAGVLTVSNMPHPARAEYPPNHAPIGTAQGIHPGRVVWVYNPGATDWAGFSSTDRWYQDSHTDPVIVERMLSQSVRALAGKSTDAEAWDAIFRYYNQRHGRGDRGYYSGEKIMIKLNLVTCNVQVGNVSVTTWDKTNASKNCVDVSPQMVRALLKHLVVYAGVTQSNITVGDSTAYWPNCYLTQIYAEYPNVKYQQNGYNYTSAPYRTAAAFSSSPFNWSTSAANGKLQDNLPTSYAQADYLINLTNLKGHSSGVTLCGKNNYGSLIRLPNGWLNGASQNFYNMHYSLPNNYADWSPGIGHYRAIVDLMGHPGLGGKTLLYLIDGLYGGYYSDAHPYKWNSAPFNGDWPSSLLASQDPVAIDSVGYDFLKAEWPDIVSGGTQWPGSLEGGAEDYLHEAALADSPPSGMFYDPDKNGIAMQSLGVHEHWNDASHKQYSRNLGGADGIELVSLTYDSGAVQRAKQAQDNTSVVVAGAVVTAAFQDYFYIESGDREFGIRVNKAGHGLAVGMRANASGPVLTNADGERYIAATTVSAAGTGTIAPVHTAAKALGGSGWNYDSYTGSGQRGVENSHGLNNIGLLVRISGLVVEVESVTPPNTPTWFRIDDGSGRLIKCISDGGSPVIEAAWQGRHVGVTGISSCEFDGGYLVSKIRLRTSGVPALY